MKYCLLGDYYLGSFESVEKNHSIIDENYKKVSPADLSDELWSLSVSHQNVDAVLDSSLVGFQAWRKTPLSERINFFSRYQEVLEKRAKEIATAISLETGKPFWEAEIEVKSVIAKVDVTINDSLPRIKNQEIDEILPKTIGREIYKPLGPCLILGPFNFPCHLANGQILSALIAGNSIIFKPSEKTAYSGQLLIECFHEAGFPKGVINLINGGAEIVKRILSEKLVKGVFFTGSVEVGKKILKMSYQDLNKLVALELGGRNTTILHKDTNIAHALKEMLMACFYTSGQRCTSTAVIAIHEDIEQEFIERFHLLAKKIVVDHPFDYKEEPFMGPLIDEKSLETYLSFMGMAKREGLEEIMRGKKLERVQDGYYVSPSLHHCSPKNLNGHFIKSELFGPNCTFVPYHDIEEAIQISNMNEYGLAGSVFTKDRSVINKCLDDIEVGIFNINRSTIGASSKLPFGGIKNSGNYRPAGIAMIDSCSSPMASLEVKDINEGNIEENIKMRGLSVSS